MGPLVNFTCTPKRVVDLSKWVFYVDGRKCQTWDMEEQLIVVMNCLTDQKATCQFLLDTHLPQPDPKTDTFIVFIRNGSIKDKFRSSLIAYWDLHDTKKYLNLSVERREIRMRGATSEVRQSMLSIKLSPGGNRGRTTQPHSALIERTPPPQVAPPFTVKIIPRRHVYVLVDPESPSPASTNQPVPPAEIGELTTHDKTPPPASLNSTVASSSFTPPPNIPSPSAAIPKNVWTSPFKRKASKSPEEQGLQKK